MTSVRSAAPSQQLTLPAGSTLHIRSSQPVPQATVGSAMPLVLSGAQHAQQQIMYTAPQQQVASVSQPQPLESSVQYETYEVEQPVTYQIQKVENVEVVLKHKYKVPITTQKYVQERCFRGEPQLIGTERSEPVIQAAQPVQQVYSQQPVQYVQQPVQYVQQQPMSYTLQTPVVQGTGYTLQRPGVPQIGGASEGYSYQLPTKTYEGVKTFN